MTAALDERDQTLIESRFDKMANDPAPRVGDYARFADGIERRISYRWRDDAGWDGGCQTSDVGSWYLGNFGCSFSGSLYPAVPTDELLLTDEQRDGSVWVFHHDHHTAHNGVHASIPFRVYECPTREAPR